MRSPTYSMIRVPLRMRRVANTPEPAMGEGRTSNGGAFVSLGVGTGAMMDQRAGS